MPDDLSVERRRIHLLSRAVLAFVFFYHGVIPKILFPSEVEWALMAAHVPEQHVEVFSMLAGAGEMTLAACILLLRTAVWPVYLAAVLLVALLADVAVVAPNLLAEAFNPVTTNLASLLLCYFMLITQDSQRASRRGQTP